MTRLLFLNLFTIFALLTGPVHAASGETVHVKVLGLVCEFCAQSIEKVLMNTDQVASVDVDLDKALVTIIMKEGQTFTNEAITASIKDAGYAVESIHHMTEPDHE